MRSYLCLCAAALLLSGCTFSQDGIGIYWPVETPQEVYDSHNAQLLANAEAAGLTDVTIDQTGLIVTGSTGPYRPFTDSNIQEHYDEYVELTAKQRGKDHVPLTFEEFRTQYVGWTSVSPIAIPGVGKTFVYALIEEHHSESIEYASGFTSFLVGDTDDYVAVKTNLDGWFYIVRLLCPDDIDYYSCTAKYSSGYFDQLTGQEVNRKTAIPLENGDLIDVDTFQEIEKK